MMSELVVVGVISAAVSLATTGATLVSQSLLAKRERNSSIEIDRKKREDDVLKLFYKYRAPLLVSANALQSRFYNIVRKRLFESNATAHATHGCGRTYAVESTLLVLCDYLGWREAIRREIQFFETGEFASTRQINEILERISHAMADTSRYGDGFVIFRSQQRAIGDLMLTTSEVGGDHWECVGPVAFCELLGSPSGRLWLDELERQVMMFVDGLRPDVFHRLCVVQNLIVDLVDMLDPGRMHIASKRSRLPLGDVPAN